MTAVAIQDPPAQKQTWFCTHCGSREIHHDATVIWNEDREDWDVVHVHDGMACTACMDRCREAGEEPVIGTIGAFDGSGSPMYGIPPALPDGD